MVDLLQDLRYAWRVLAKSPGFTAVAVIALALGIGANTAVFSVVDAVLLRPLPYGDPDRLVRVSQSLPGAGGGAPGAKGAAGAAAPAGGSGGSPGGAGAPTSAANFVDWSTQNHVFTGMSAFGMAAFNITGRDEPERVIGGHVTPNLFEVLKVRAVVGRTFDGEDARASAEPVVVISHGFWQRHFAADAAALGRTLDLDGIRYRVIGVTPADFTFGKDAQLWVPLLFSPKDLANRGAVSLSAVARLRPGVTIEQARSNMAAVAAHIAEQYPGVGDHWGVQVVSLKDQVVGNFRGTLFILLGAVVFVLLVGCANVANLLLARAAQRGREIAIRTAVGASRARLIRQTLTESVLLGLLGGGLGLLLALWCISLMVKFNPGNIPRLDEVGIDGPVLAFTLGISLLTGIVFGLAPALQVSGNDLQRALKEGSAQSSNARRRHLVRNLLVVSEVAMALVLLIGAGLMIRSFQLLQAVDPGFSPGGVTTLRMSLPARKYPEPYQRLAFFQDVLGRAQQLPGVKSASLTTTLPLEGGEIRELIFIEGRSISEDQPPGGGLDAVSPDYFRVMGIALLKGRSFTPLDREGSPPVVIIDESMAKLYWPDQSPLGKRLMIPGVKAVYREIVGVVKGLKFYGLEQERRPTMYVPFLQDAEERSMGLAVKSDADPAQMAAALRTAIWAVDREQTVSPAMTMDQLLARSVAQRRFNTGMIEIFAFLGLLLAVVGIHGVLAYSVSQRTQEIGIRMALGAERGRVLQAVLGQALGMVAIGVAIGIAASLGLTRLMASLLFGVSPLDPVTYIGMSLLLLCVALVASYIPARKATRVDPLVALRYE